MAGTLIPANQPPRSQVIGGLRELADYLDRDPAIPVHEDGWDFLVFAYSATQASGRAEVDEVASVLGVAAAADTPRVASTSPRERSGPSPTTSST